MLCGLFGLVPDENTTQTCTPRQLAAIPHQPRTNFWQRGAFGGPVKEIPLTNSPLFALVDDEDYDKVLGKPWFLAPNGYIRYSDYSTGKCLTITLHAFLFPAPKGMCRDHINHNKLDNRRCNVRVVTVAQNGQNKSARKTSKSSQYKGVCWNKKIGKWQARIKKDWKPINLGIYEHEVSAAKAYNAAAVEFFGEFACLNEIDASLPEVVESEPWKPMVKKSKFIGVISDARVQKWRVIVRVNGVKQLPIRRFKTELEAAAAYNEKAILHYGEYAHLNQL